MNDKASPRASDLAAKEVERIVAAAQEAADQIRAEASHVEEQARRRGEQDAERMRAEARREAQQELESSRKEALLFGQDARREAQLLVEEAQREAAKLREQTRRTIEGRVVRAEKAASEVLAEARALSGGLRQLGKSLEDHADRILRDVQAAHKRMQADLRIDLGQAAEPASSPEPGDAPAREEAEPPTRKPSGRKRPKPLADLELPSWVARKR